LRFRLISGTTKRIRLRNTTKSDSSTKQTSRSSHTYKDLSLSRQDFLSHPMMKIDRFQSSSFWQPFWSSFTEIANPYQCCDENPPCLTKKKLEEKKFGDESFYFSKNLLASEYWKEKPVLNYSTNEITTTSFDIGCDYFGLLFILNSILIIYEALVRNVELFFHISHIFLHKKNIFPALSQTSFKKSQLKSKTKWLEKMHITRAMLSFTLNYILMFYEKKILLRKLF